MQEKFNDFKINFLKRSTRSRKQRVCQGTIMSWREGKWRRRKGGSGQAKLGAVQSALSGLHQCLHSAKSRENKESKIQVNKLIGDLHKQLLQQGKNKVILASFYSFLNSLVQTHPGNVNVICKNLKAQLLNPVKKKGTKLPVKISFLTELKVIMVELPLQILIPVAQVSEEAKLCCH